MNCGADPSKGVRSNQIGEWGVALVVTETDTSLKATKPRTQRETSHAEAYSLQHLSRLPHLTLTLRGQDLHKYGLPHHSY